MKNLFQPLGTATSTCTGNMYQESDIKNQQANKTQKTKEKRKTMERANNKLYKKIGKNSNISVKASNTSKFIEI